MKHKCKDNNQARIILKEILKGILNNNKFPKNKQETSLCAVYEDVLMTISQLFWKMFEIQFQKL